MGELAPSRRSDLKREKRRQQLAERRRQRERLLTSEGRAHLRRSESPGEIFYRHRGLTWLIAALMGALPTAIAVWLAGLGPLVIAGVSAAVGGTVFAFFLIVSWLTRTTVVPDLGVPHPDETQEQRNERRERRGASRVEWILNGLDALLGP